MEPLDLQRGPTAAARCASRARPPRVAICVAGAARAFSSPLVMEGLRANLVAPLAGPEPHRSGTRLFLALKLADSAKRISGVAFGQHVSPLPPLVAALSSSWLTPLVGEAVIVNGSGALDPSRPGTTARQLQAGVEPATYQADGSLWRAYRATPCPQGEGSSRPRGATTRNATRSTTTAHADPAPGGEDTITSLNASGREPVAKPERSLRPPSPPCCRMSGYLVEGSNEERLIHQHLGLAWCAAASTLLRTSNRGPSHNPRCTTIPASLSPEVPASLACVAVLRYEARVLAQTTPSTAHTPTAPWDGALVRPRRLDGTSAMAPGAGPARRTFEVIVFSRPDLIWWQPLPAWCDWASGAAAVTTTMLTCDRPGCDMAWVSPRQHLDRLMGQAALHRDCTHTSAPPHGAGRVRNVRQLASCCATSEWLLWFAQSSRAAAGAREIAVLRTSALEPERTHFSLLREANHACERSLSRSYDRTHALALQQRHGLSAATSARLRRLFGEGNVSACRRALEPWRGV